MSGDGLRSSVREQRAGKALRHDMDRQTSPTPPGTGGDARAARPEGSHSDCESGDVGRQLYGGSQKTSDAGGPQEGKREIGATAIGAAFWGGKSGVTPQNQDESRNKRGSRALLWGRRERRRPRPRPGEENAGATDGDRGNASNDAAVGGAKWATISGETSRRRENRVRTAGNAVQDDPRDNAPAARGNYSP